MTFKCDHQTTYNRDELQPRMVHIGCGAFHRGHQAVYNDICNELSQEELWGIAEISLRGSSSIVEDLKEQNFTFCVLETNGSGKQSRLIRTVTDATMIAHEGYAKVRQWCAHEDLRIVSLTVTEKGYCVDPITGRLNSKHADIEHDLNNPDRPKSAIGLLALALSLRYSKGLKGISILSCDNMPQNGLVLKTAVMDFLIELNPLLAHWVESNVSFPSTMVDRIVPAMTMPSRQELNKNVGTSDKCGVICESFRQWVIEDNFVAGRPEWQLAGATFVNDVVPFEDAKLRLLNGSHTVMAIIGSLMGIDSVNLSMDNPNLRSAIVLFMEEQTCSLRPEFDISVDSYIEALISRFQNPNIKHLLLQIAMDSSQKIPVRIIHPMSLLKKQGSSIRTHIFLLSAWVHFVERFFDDGSFDDGSFDVKVSDPKSGDLMSLLATRKHYQPTEWCEKVLITSGFFQDRDVLLSELLSDISDGYKSINADGVEGALLGLLSNSTHVQAFKLVKDFNENVNL